MHKSVCCIHASELQRVMRECSDSTNAGLLISAGKHEKIKILSQLSQKQKNAIMAEMKGAHWITEAYLKASEDSFWKTAEDMERKGEIILRR